MVGNKFRNLEKVKYKTDNKEERSKSPKFRRPVPANQERAVRFYPPISVQVVFFLFALHSETCVLMASVSCFFSLNFELYIT
jgi:hypothetical protein